MTDKKLVFNSQENDEYLGVQCFQVDPNLEEKEIPTSGEEYLLKVMKERARYATISKCKLDHSVIYKNQCNSFKEVRTLIFYFLYSYFFSLVLNNLKLQATTPHKPDKLKPTIEWQNIQIADFSDLHLYVIRMAARKKELLPSIFQETYKDFIVDDAIQWRQVFETTEPTLSHVVGLTHSVVEMGLETILSIMHRVKPGQSIDRRTGTLKLSDAYIY